MAAMELLENIDHGGCVDQHMQDQVTIQADNNQLQCNFLCVAAFSGYYLHGDCWWRVASAMWTSHGPHQDSHSRRRTDDWRSKRRPPPRFRIGNVLYCCFFSCRRGLTWSKRDKDRTSSPVEELASRATNSREQSLTIFCFEVYAVTIICLSPQMVQVDTSEFSCTCQ